MQRQRIGKRHWKTRDDPPVQFICINAARKVASGSVGSENRPWPTCLAMTAPALVLLPSHSFTQWGQLGEILGGVQDPCAAPAAVQPLPWLREEASNRSEHQNFKSRGGSAVCRAAPWLKENLMNPNIDFLGICQLLKALRTVGFSENDIKKIARRIAVELGANFTLYA